MRLRVRDCAPKNDGVTDLLRAAVAQMHVQQARTGRLDGRGQQGRRRETGGGRLGPRSVSPVEGRRQERSRSSTQSLLPAKADAGVTRQIRGENWGCYDRKGYKGHGGGSASQN